MEKSISRRTALRTIALGALGSIAFSETGCKKSINYISGETKTIRLLLSYGQSNSIGAGSTGDAVTTRQVYDSLMFNGGPRPDPAIPGKFTSFVPLIEGSKGFSETPLSGCAETIISNFELNEIQSLEKKSWQFLCAAPGVGGETIAALSKGSSTGYYQRAIMYAKYAKKITDAFGGEFEIPIMLWTHGGADISHLTETKLNYYNSLNQLIKDYNTDLPSISGQQNMLLWIGNQECVRSSVDQDGVAQAQFDVMLYNPLFTLCNPVYILQYEADKAHYKPAFDRIQGAYYGLYATKWLQSFIKPLPLYPLDFTVNGSGIIIKYHVPQPPLVFDTSWVEAAPNLGFRVKDAFNKEMSVSSVSITTEDSITIQVDGDPAGGSVLYARPEANEFVDKGTYLMPGGRGNLRDSQGDYISCYNFAMHNYSLAFNIKL